MMTRVLLTFLALTLWGATPANAKRYAIYPLGDLSCPDYAVRRKAGANALGAMGWVMGYLSAYNVFVAAKLDELYSAAIEGVDQETRHEQHETYAKIPPIDIKGDLEGKQVFAWIDQYCATHPFENLNKATRALIWELENRSERPHELPEEK